MQMDEDNMENSGISNAITSLRASNERFKTLFEAAADAIFLYDKRGHIIDANEFSSLFSGYTNTELLSMSCKDICVGESEINMEKLFNILEYGPVTVKDKFRRKDGSIFPVEIRAGLLECGGEVFGMAIVRDITERVMLEERELKQRESLLQRQKLESLGGMAGGIAHDFNNIFQGILGNLSLAKRKVEPNSVIGDYLIQIERSARRAAELTNQLLAYSGGGHFILEAANLSDVVYGAHALISASIPKKAVVEYNLKPNLPPISVDTSQCLQALMNIVQNASESLGDGTGVISISTGSSFCDENFFKEAQFCENYLEGEYVWLKVSDTGCGMNKENLSKIFDPFYSTKFVGRGLGLPAVLGIVRGHKGAISIETEPEKGFAITLFLPSSTSAPQIEAAKHEKTPSIEGRYVLFVDDEEIVREVAFDFLEQSGFKALLASDGAEAIRLFKERREEISCVVLDLTMPIIDGTEVLEKILELAPETKIILSSGFDEKEASKRLKGKSVCGFLKKPYPLAKLVEKINEIIC